MSLYDHTKAIKVGFDPSYILMCMKMWRDALDMKIPLHDDFKVHFMANRRTLLEGYEKTGHAWGMLLGEGSMLAEDHDQLRLVEILAKVKEFKEWARAGLDDLDRIAAAG